MIVRRYVLNYMMRLLLFITFVIIIKKLRTINDRIGNIGYPVLLS